METSFHYQKVVSNSGKKFPLSETSIVRKIHVGFIADELFSRKVRKSAKASVSRRWQACGSTRPLDYICATNQPYFQRAFTMETIKITVQGFDFDEIATELKNFAESDGLEVKVKPSSVDFGGLALDPATIIVSGAGVLSSLITALFAYLATKRNGSIIITGSGGRKIEIPKNTPKEEIEFYIEQARKLDAEQIALIKLP